MPFQGPPWTEFISCPVCFKVFNEKQQRPISLGCGHTICKSCIKRKLTEKRCPFDQIDLPSDADKLPANFALMHLVGVAVSDQDREVTPKDTDHPECFKQARKCIEEMAVHLKPLADNASDDDSDTCCDPGTSKVDSPLITTSPYISNGELVSPGKPQPTRCVLSRPMQRKLISLIHCQLFEEESRSRAARIARSLGERIVSELLILHQHPHQLSANLWAAVRTRGCQFLGPAMQEEVIKLILLALEDGSFLSRKVLVLFVVQRLESRYPQASKTAIGHVVQLLYRASCFKVEKREEESSLMQLKEDFRQYESLRREHDSQIVQIAIEAGLRISPEQWSSLLYGDSAHKSHMQSIIDKHQSPQSFTQTLTELMIALQRSGYQSCLQKMQPQLEFLSKIDPSPECPGPSWENLEAIMRCLNIAVNTFVDFVSNIDHRLRLETTPIHNARYKTSKCRDFASRGTCPRGNTCTFAHTQEELERYRSRSRRGGNQGVAMEKTSSALTPSESDQLRQVQLMSNLKLEAVESPVHKDHDAGPSSPSQVPKLSPVPGISAVQYCSSKDYQCVGSTIGSERQSFTMESGDLLSKPLYSYSTFQMKTTSLVHNLDPEKPPFVPLGVSSMPPAHLTFSNPAINGDQSKQTAFHPNDQSTKGSRSSKQTAFHPNDPNYFAAENMGTPYHGCQHPPPQLPHFMQSQPQHYNHAGHPTMYQHIHQPPSIASLSAVTQISRPVNPSHHATMPLSWNSCPPSTVTGSNVYNRSTPCQMVTPQALSQCPAQVLPYVMQTCLPPTAIRETLSPIVPIFPIMQLCAPPPFVPNCDDGSVSSVVQFYPVQPPVIHPQASLLLVEPVCLPQRELQQIVDVRVVTSDDENTSSV